MRRARPRGRRVLASALGAAAAAFLGLWAPGAAAVARPAQEAEVVVGMTDTLVFAPAVLTVPAGTTVTWANWGYAPHAVTATDGAFDSGTDSSQWIQAGGSYAVHFASPGTYQYMCLPHLVLGMVGEIVVE